MKKMKTPPTKNLPPETRNIKSNEDTRSIPEVSGFPSKKCGQVRNN
jgi:hypothetical protein